MIRIIEAQRPIKAAQFYLSAADVSIVENRSIQADDYSAKASVIFLKLKDFENASSALQKQMEFLEDSQAKNTAGRVVAYMILVHLAREDFVSAQKAYKDYNKYTL